MGLRPGSSSFRPTRRHQVSQSQGYEKVKGYWCPSVHRDICVFQCINIAADIYAQMDSSIMGVDGEFGGNVYYFDDEVEEGIAAADVPAQPFVD